ncbi:MAG TPA: fibronectin type III domain-containing protein, partial [Candidatus Binatia bacterium]|nr:fibronectin type III domain-containing protein [Candidatus Binatia bacterium]
YKGAGAGNGMVTNALYFMHPGYLGQSQELGRDMGHASLDPVLLAQLCEVAWNQGDDLFGYDNNALLAISEMTSRAMTSDAIPWVNYAGCDATATAPATGSNYRAGLDMIWNHYVNIKGLSAPYTMASALANRPEGGGGNYGGNSGGFDQLGFTTLTHALDPISNTSAPSALRADAPLAGTARVWWYGSAYATGYNVKRATTSGGPYSLIASNQSAQNFLYTDTNLTPGTTYYYVVSAIINGVETTNSLPVSVTANQRLTGTVIGTTGSYTWGQWRDQLFDNAPITYFDAPDASGDWGGLDLGDAYRITKVGYYPRDNFASRMTGGKFQGCNVADFSSGVVTFFTIGSQPPQGTTTIQNVADKNGYRYVRYLGPANGYCNAAEIQFEGYLYSTAVSPLAPLNVAAVAGNSQVALSWNAVTNASSYNILRSLTTGGTCTLITNVAATAFTDTAVTNGVMYYYVLRSTNDVGESSNSLEVSARPVSLAPANLSLNPGGGQLQFSWPADHTGWRLQMSTNLATEIWQDMTGTDTTNSVSILPTNSNAFFRLVYP